MSIRRWSPKADAGQVVIVEALRKAGAKVLSLGAVGRGCPDLLCSARGYLFLVEVKRPKGKRGGSSESGQKLNEAQEAFLRAWGEHIFVVTTPEEAVDVVNGVSRLALLEAAR